MAWQLKGQLIESCTCNMFCPCWFGVKELMVMDEGWCAGSIAFRLRDGNSDGVDLGDRTVVVAVDWPGPTLFDGNGTARVFIDDGADDRQRQELEAIYTGKRGGPMAIIDSLVSTWLPARTARIDVSDQGDEIRLTVGEAGTVVSNLLKDGD